MPDAPARSHAVFRFGAFELDVRAGELRKAGVRVGIQEQSLQVLTLLLERSGDLVTREELRQRLWPNGTFVDYEHGLNAVINRLREALGDAADSPRFIQTVPRRGYRFITHVAQGVRGQEVLKQRDGEPRYAPESEDTVDRLDGTRRYRLVVWSAIVLTVAISLALVLYQYRSRPVPSGPMRSIPLTTLPGHERHPSFSPDGDRIAFIWAGEKGDNEDIYVKVVGTERPFRLTTSPSAEQYPAWSPDGRHIAFYRTSAAGSERRDPRARRSRAHNPLPIVFA